jgi:hypothetical protein
MKNGKTLFYIGIYAIAGYGVYYYFFSKKRYAQIIVNSGSYKSGIEPILSFDKPYLKAWSKAVKSSQPTFFFNRKEYSTQGGSIKK